MNLPAAKNRRILIIDDNRAIHDDFRKILSPATIAAAALDVAEAELFGKPVPQGGMDQQVRYEIDSAYQGQEGVLLVKQALEAGRPYAMAFVDVRMPPGMDGVETTRKIWELDPDLQVVFCTAYSDYSWGEMFEKLGQHDGLLILKKPFDTVEALQLAHALTEKWWLHQQSRQKMEGLEGMVAGRTRELQQSNQTLQTEVVERKRMEEELRDSESQLQVVLESTADGILAVDSKGKVIKTNQRFAEIWRIPQSLMDARDDRALLDFVLEQLSDPDAFLKKVQSLYGTDAVDMDTLVFKDGRVFERYSSPMLTDGAVTGRVWSFRDITERKRAEEALRESQASLESAQSINRMGSWDLDLTKGGGQWSKEMFHLFNFDPAAGAPQFNEFLVAIHPEDRARFAEAHQRVAESGEQARLEFRSNPAHGPIHHFDSIMQGAKGSCGPVRRLAGTVQDITERKRAEEALRENEERFSGAFEYAPIGVALVTPDGRYLKVNRVLCELVGYSEAELLTRTFQDITHPEDLEVDLENVRRLLAGETRSYQMEKRYVHARGHLVTVLLNVSLVRDGQGQPLYFVSQVQDITERKLLEAELNRERDLWRTLLDNSPDHIYFKDTQSRFIKSSKAQALQFGVKSPDEMVGKTDFDFFTEAHARPAFEDEQEIIRTGQPMVAKEEREVWKDGHVTWASSTKMPMRDGAGKIIGIMGISRDITGRKQLEAQLFQSQKMETVGKLAGGIAHEFNSILTAIIGQSELLLEDLPAGSPLCQNATEIIQAADRAATLTRQILAYGRKQFLQPEALDLNRVIAGMEGMFHHLLGGDVDTQIVPASDLHLVKADAGQIEQVIMNMVINARDAMPNRGKLMLETANVSFDQDGVGHYPDLKPGDYVMLAITDTGTGMSEEVKARVFEPFFTTKGVGEGTGLGLSSCYGIVKQSGGHISVYSEPGRGTTFKIYLPQVEPQANISIPRLDSPDLPGGTETILLVEDDPALREMAATLLRRLGYKVLAANHGIEALSLCHQRDTGYIDLLFTDVVMPHMSGKELADRVRVLYPHTKFLFTSAYTENAIVHQGVLDKGVALLQKPFTPSALARKVREVLDQAKPPGS
jgi:PAS domain S-box-containing protein